MINYRLHLIRHGATRANIEGRYTGRTDIPLCDQGIAELNELARRYDYPPAEMVAASPLSRCLQTAEILYPDTYLEPWEEFIEYDFGEFEGKTVAELHSDYRFHEWVAGRMSDPPPGGESAGQLTARIVRGMRKLFQRMMEDRLTSVALITHGGIITSLLYGMGLPRRNVADCSVGNGRGYTLLLNTQMWMRDSVFEIYGIVPYGLPESGIRGELKNSGGRVNGKRV